MILARQWYAIAKAELLVKTAKIRRARKLAGIAIVCLALTWALVIAPQIMSFILNILFDEFHAIVSFSLPGFMRSVMLSLWLFVLIIPISNGLEEIRVGHWEILLSNNVKTKDILIGTFLGKLPVFGLMVVILAPIIVSPFTIAFNVSILGQLLVYGVIIILAVTTIWISNIIVTAIQAKLGDSSRGNDIAKAMSWAIVPIVFLPMMGIMYFMGAATEVLGLPISTLLPSTWGADLVTWIIVSDLPASSIMNLTDILFLPALFDLAILSMFILIVAAVGRYSADKLFVIGAGARTEVVTTVGRENIFLRGVRRVFPARIGVLMITSLKDFGRKAQNLSKIGYTMFLIILMPIIMRYSGIYTQIQDPLFLPVITMIMVGMMLGIMAANAFGGVGFLESKDHVWILKSNPKGVLNFVKSRVGSYFLIGIFYAMVPAALIGFVMEFGVLEILVLMIFAYAIVCGTIMISIGVTAFNPAYEDTKSSAFVMNTFASMIISIIPIMTGIIWAVIQIIAMDIMVVPTLLSVLPVLCVGVVVLSLGTIRLNRTEAF
ncbi:MAG: hypothetical protein RTU92_03020 [Candidatus Thorarchaeota archaeon]